MLSSTFLTPLAFRAMSTACWRASSDGTVPLRVTIPSVVVTEMVPCLSIVFVR